VLVYLGMSAPLATPCHTNSAQSMLGSSELAVARSPAFCATFLAVFVLTGTAVPPPLLLLLSPLLPLLLLLMSLLLLLLPEHFPGQLPSTVKLSVLDRKVEPGVGVLPFADVTLTVT